MKWLKTYSICVGGERILCSKGVWRRKGCIGIGYKEFG